MKILRLAYAKIWVPTFGRLLYRFVELIEGNKSKEKPTYDIESTNDK